MNRYKEMLDSNSSVREMHVMIVLYSVDLLDADCVDLVAVSFHFFKQYASRNNLGKYSFE